MNEPNRYGYHIDPDDQSTSARVLRLVGHGKRVLELGTAVGSMTRVMKEHYGCRIAGIEMDPDMAEQARPYCDRLVLGDLESLDWSATFGEERFEVVVAADVLEHLRDPWTCLRAAREYLRPDGALVVSVPNIAHTAVLAQLLVGRFPYSEKGLLDRTHLRFFTRSDLEDMLLATGFLPITWERNEVGVPETELGGAWWALPQRLRDYLIRQPEGRTYQFIVKAVCASDLGALQRLQADLSEARAAVQREQAIADGYVKELAVFRKELAVFRKESLVRQNALQTAFQDAEKAFHEYRDAYHKESARRVELERRLGEQAEATARIAAENSRLAEQVRNPGLLIGAAVRARLRRWTGGV